MTSFQLQDLYIDVTLLSETHLKPVFGVRIGSPHNPTGLPPPLVSVKATGAAND
jgi:hypothetical protein